MNPSAAWGRLVLVLVLVLVLMLVLVLVLVLVLMLMLMLMLIEMLVLMHGRLIVRVPVLEVAMPGAHGSFL
jgi:hypothetical protein